MDTIVKPLTPDGLCGWDKHNQLWSFFAIRGGGHMGHLIGDPRGHKCRICLQGWVLTTESLRDQRWDRDYEEWTHLSCFIRYLGLCERDMWNSALFSAKLWFKAIQEIPNEYWRNDPPYSNRPWYRIILRDTERTLKLGRRKRVYHMEIEPGNKGLYSPTVANELFKDEDVTKSICKTSLTIHAWNDEKAQKYLKAFHEILCLNLKPQPSSP